MHQTESSSSELSSIELAIFISRVESICAEMGAILQRAAFSPNIKDRLDFSCALFDVDGNLFAQAAHIPVHLGSMAYAMADIIEGQAWQAGDMLVVNDPFLGGTHLPDVTVVAPLFAMVEEVQKLIGFVANRAHHANIGATTPGSMPLSQTLSEEGLIIPPLMFVKAYEPDAAFFADFEAAIGLSEADTSGDFAAQMSANKIGITRLQDLVMQLGVANFSVAVAAVNDYGERLARSVIAEIPNGEYCFSDAMDNDGYAAHDIELRVKVSVSGDAVSLDFAGTAEQVGGNVNCPLSVAAASVFYVFRCLLPETAPNCAGVFAPIELIAPHGCLIHAKRPAATAAGNVETSMRIVDVVLGALAKAIPDQIPAASQGTMNNVAMGNHQDKTGLAPWDYYETIAGGMGASAMAGGLSAVQCHMTNTLNTPIESLEQHYPLRIERYEVRGDSGGGGQNRGGDGLLRSFRFLAETEITLLTERRNTAPWGISGGLDGAMGSNSLDGEPLPAKCHRIVAAGQRLDILTPGGGGFGKL